MSVQPSSMDHRIQELAQRIEHLEANRNQSNFDELEGKLDQLLAHMQDQQRRQQERDELRDDLLPIANQVIKLSIDELSEIGSDFQLEDVLFLAKRLLRDTHLLGELLQRIESAADLIDESKGIGQQIFHETIMRLDELERKGYFAFANGGVKILDRIVSEFTEDDVNALGENIVTILKTVKNLTQPEIMSLTNNAASALRETAITVETPSAWALVRELSDPQVRKGMARLVGLVRSFAEEPVHSGKS